MILTRRKFLASTAGAGLLSGCAVVDVGRVATQSKDLPSQEGGIGGTGVDGMGVNGVGIFGALTDFGSLMVNGRRVETPSDVVYADAFGSISRDRLEIGHSLTIETVKEGETLIARRVELTQPLVGPVDAVADEGAALRVLGIAVRVDPAAIRPLHVGERVAVSGVWRGETVEATRLDPAPEDGRDALAGVLAPPDASGSRRVGGGRLVPPRGAAPGAARYVSAVGRWTPLGDGAVGGVLKAESARFGRFTGAAPLTELSVEGFLEPIGAAPFFEISGLGHSFDAAARLEPFAAARAVFDGPYDGDFRVATATTLSGAFAARRDALRSGAALQGDAVLR